MKVYYETQHVERLTKALWSILADELDYPVRIEFCLAAVASGLSLQRRRRPLPTGERIGRAWLSEAAFQQLGVLGYVYDARLAMEAIRRLEARHIIRRRGDGAAEHRKRGDVATPVPSRTNSVIPGRSEMAGAPEAEGMSEKPARAVSPTLPPTALGFSKTVARLLDGAYPSPPVTSQTEKSGRRVKRRSERA